MCFTNEVNEKMNPKSCMISTEANIFFLQPASSHHCGTNAKLNIYFHYYLDSSNHLQRILFMGTFKGNCAINGVNLRAGDRAFDGQNTPHIIVTLIDQQKIFLDFSRLIELR